jgi:hypothetical protein
LRAWSTLMSRTKTCMQRSLFDQVVDGPEALGLPAHGYAPIRVPIAPAMQANLHTGRSCACRWAPWLPIRVTQTSLRSFFGAALGQVITGAGVKEQ